MPPKRDHKRAPRTGKPSRPRATTTAPRKPAARAARKGKKRSPQSAMIRQVSSMNMDGDVNAEQWSRGLMQPFTIGLRQRVPDATSMLPTYAFPLYSRGTLTTVVPSAATNTREIMIQVFPDPYYGFTAVTAETGLGIWNTAAQFGLPSNLSTLTSSAAIYRTVSMGLHVYNTAAVQARGGTYFAANAYTTVQRGATSITGVDATSLGSMTQVVKGDAAALGGEGLRFNWLPCSDRNTIVPYGASGNPPAMGFTALAWRAPTYANGGSVLSDSSLFFRVIVNDATETNIAFDYEIVWNVEFLPLSSQEQTFPGVTVVGSSSAVTNVVEKIESAGASVIREQLVVPGQLEPMERGGLPAGSGEPLAVQSIGAPTLGDSLVHGAANVGKKLLGNMTGGVSDMAFDFLSGLTLRAHKIACAADRPDLSPLAPHVIHNHAVHARGPRRVPLRAAPVRDLAAWSAWFGQAIQRPPPAVEPTEATPDELAPWDAGYDDPPRVTTATCLVRDAPDETATARTPDGWTRVVRAVTTR